MAIDAGVLTQIEEHYQDDILDVLFEDGKDTSPVLAMSEAKADNDGFGRGYIIRMTTHEGAAVAADPSVADTINDDGSTGGQPLRDRWVVQPVSMDAPFAFSRDDILSIEKMGKDEQFDVITENMDMAVKRIRNLLAEQVSGKGWGKLAVTTAQTTTGFTVNRAFINRFPIGARLVASVSEDTDVLLGSAAQLIVTAVNTATGVVTTSGNPVTTWANNATLYIFRAGMRPATDPGSDQSLKTCISGLEAWIDPTGATLWGVTRTGNPNKSGYGIDCTGMDTAQGLIEIADTLFSYGRRSDTIVCSGTSWKLLQLDYDPSRLVNVTLGEYKIGFTGYRLATMFGESVVIPDPFMAPGDAYAGPFQKKKYGPQFRHAGDKLVNLDDFDGKQFERQTSGGARKFKGQFFFRGNFVLGAPGMYAKGSNLPTS